MLPIAEDGDQRRGRPYVTTGLVVGMVVIGLWMGVPDGSGPFRQVVDTYGLVPSRFWANPSIEWPGLLTATFLHGGPLHLATNMLFLWVFGRALEHEMRWAYLPFYLVCGIGASLVSALVRSTSDTPGIGASGAISGLLGAFFVLHAYASIRAIVLIPWLFIVAILRGESPVWDVPAWAVILTWFVLQLAMAVAPARMQGNTDYAAHLGGFAVGYLTIRLARGVFGLWPDEPEYQRLLDRPSGQARPVPTSYVRAARLIPAGAIVQREDVEWINRKGYVDPDVVPGYDGLQLVGRRARTAIYRYEPIRWQDVEEVASAAGHP